jgi:DNA adenine methylase
MKTQKKEKTVKVRPPFKIQGGKHHLAPWIIEHFPPDYENLVYVEPYCGAASILLSKKPSREEYINDIDPGIITILRAIRDNSSSFSNCLQKLECCKETFDDALTKTTFDNTLDCAANEFILRRLSRDGQKKTFYWSARQKEDSNAWQNSLSKLYDVAERLDRVIMFNSEAIDVMHAFNESDVLLYLDPTPLPDAMSQDAPAYEMTIDDHIELANMISVFKGKVAISGHPSNLYGRIYSDWRCVKKRIVSPKNKSTKTEVLWMNY